MKISIPTSEMPLPDGSVMHLILSKDWQQLQAALDSIEAQTIEIGPAPERDAWLVHRPNKNGKCAPRPDDCRTRAKCPLCQGRVFWWANQKQLWLHCDCTQFIAPRGPESEPLKNMTAELWQYCAGVAFKGIQQWLATS